jgi:Trk K+ transport system NAD-binding subunit
MPYRTAYKYGKYTLRLLREFRWPLAVIGFLILAGGLQFSLTMDLPYLKCCYTVFMLMLAQPTIDFPAQWYNQALFFLVPILGLGAIADSVVRLGYLIFSFKKKPQEWWIMEASTYRNHIVLVGLGKAGLRIARELLQVNQPFVAIDRDENAEFIEEIQDLKIPVILGDARHKKTLEKANLAKAKAIILATDDDLANFDAALTAREIKQDIKVVMRLFDDTLAHKVTAAFDLAAISISQVAAPAFVAAATGRSVLHAFRLGGQMIHVADLTVERLAGRKIVDLNKEFDVSVICHKGPKFTDFSPHHDGAFEPGDTLIVMGAMEKIRKLEDINRDPGRVE